MDALALSVDNMTNRVDSTVEQTAQTEEYMPPMHWAYHSNIQQTIVGNSRRQLLDTATVILTYAYSDAEE